MNNWLYRLERKYGRFGIPNLMMYIVATMFMIFLAQMFTGVNMYGLLSLHRDSLLGGQIWRLVTFIFLPPSNNPLMLLIALLVYYSIGSNLERSWGTFSFTVYYVFGILSALLAALITGYSDNTYMNLSLFLAYACLYPDSQFRIYFLIPIKAKHLAMIQGGLYAFAFISYLIAGNWPSALALVASLLNFFLFFGPDFFNRVRNNRKYSASRKQFRKEMKNNGDIWR